MRALLETVIPTRCVQIPLESTRESVYVGRVQDERLLETADNEEDQAALTLGLGARYSEVGRWDEARQLTERATGYLIAVTEGRTVDPVGDEATTSMQS